MLNQVQPQSVEAEQAVLGAMLLSQRAVNIAFERGLARDDFYKESNAQLYAIMVELYEEGQGVDTVSTVNRAKELKQLEQIGGSYYITGLPEATPSAANVGEYIRIVKEKSDKRTLIHLASTTMKNAYDDSIPTSELIQTVETAVFSLARGAVQHKFAEYNDLLSDVIDDIDATHKLGSFHDGLSSGFVDLDNKLTGFKKGELIILAARPSIGKTALALNISAFVAEDKPVAIFSLEMTALSLAKRVLLSESGVDSQKARCGMMTTDDYKQVMDSAGKKYQIFIDDNMDLTMLEMRAKARRIKADRDISLIIVDYLQLVNIGRGLDRKINNTNDATSYISRSLKAMAKEINVPVVALSQLSRGVEARTDKRPRLSDLRDSGSLEQDADVVLMLYREAMYDPDLPRNGKAELSISKQRNGPTGLVNLFFKAESTRFENYAGENWHHR